jgi:Protein of unknown function (DUF3179)
VWESTLEGRVLHFELYGINNQNFIMRDRETGTWWQQVSGQALQGPLQGKHLKLMAHEEISFGLWKDQNTNGRVLKPDSEFLKKKVYASSDWEKRIAKLPVEAHQVRSQALPPRETIIGLQLNGDSKAYPLSLIDQHRLIVDQLGKIPLLITLATDGLTVRAFDRRVEGRALDFYVKTEDSNLFIDNTGTEWNFDGVAVSGQFAGRKLQKLVILKDFWFDWLNYHPNTSIFGERL